MAKNNYLLLILALCCAFLSSCRAFGNFWENNKEQKTTYVDSSDAVPPTVPGTPAAVNGGSTQINLTWTPASDNLNQPGALIYEICQSLGIGGCNTFTVSFVTAAGATSFNATGLNPSTTYYYRVRARDTAGNPGVETAEFSAATSAPGTVNTPTYSPVAGTFASAQLVSISSSTPGSTICYTTDGVTTPACDAVPTCTTGTTYAAAVNVSVTTTLKAIACKNSSTASSVATGLFTIDTTPPTVSNVSSSTSNGTLGVGQTISIQVTFNEIVNVTGTPQLTLATGSPATTAINYVSGTGTAVLNFDYVTAAGNSSGDLDYANTTALSLNGGSIQDAAGNAAVLTLAAPGASTSLGFNKNLVIDGVGPTVTGVSASTANGTYTVGNTISVQVTFNEAVTVTGTPQLALATGAPATTPVNYTSGSASTTLVFNYTVAAGNFSADLDYANAAALALNGGTINDASGNAAALTLVTPGTVGSLGNSKNFVIDTGGLTPGAGLSFSAIGATGLTVNWGAATDDVTPQVGLQYKIVKDNAALANIDTVAEVNAKTAPDLLQDWAASITTLPVTGLTAATTYYFAVLVRDGAGNMALYTPVAQATSAPPATKRFVIPAGSTSTTIYNSATHTFSAGPVTTGTTGNGGNSFPINSGPQAGKIMVVFGGSSTTTNIYDVAGNTFSVGPALPVAASGGTFNFAITSGVNAGKNVVVRATALTNTSLYDPSANTYSAGSALSAAAGNGASAIPINSGPQIGKTLVIHGNNSTATSLYDVSAGTYSAGPTLATNVYTGGYSFLITSGPNANKALVIHGNTTNTTSLYDPGTHTFSAGPSLTGTALTGAHSFPISSGPQAGKILLVHGNATTSTSYYDPSANTMSAGTTLPTAIGIGAHAFPITSGPQAGKILIINGNSTTGTTLFDPSVPSASAGPAMTAATSGTGGTHSWDIP